MAKTIDLVKLRDNSTDALDTIVDRIDDAAAQLDGMAVRWMCAMGAVETYTIWERYAENRLAAALNHNAKHFLSEFNIRGVKRVSSGLAFYVVRGGRFFDFRSIANLLDKGDRLLGKTANPFRRIGEDERDYLDALAAIRNKVVHTSDVATLSYKRHLRALYDIRYAPEPPEFLSALDKRVTSPLRGRRRLDGLILIVKTAIGAT